MVARARKLAASLALTGSLMLLAPVAASADYDFLRAFGSEGAGPGQFSLPLGIAVDSGGVAYVADTFNDRIQRFGPDGEFLGTIGSEGTGPKEFNKPFDVEVGDDGNLLVADTGNRRIQVLDPLSGDLVDSFGVPGSGPGQLASPTGVTVSGAEVLVVDRDNARVQRYAADGTLLGEWGAPGSGPGEFSTPLDLTVDDAGSVLVVDAGNDRIERFSASGAFETEWSGGLSTPQGIDADRGGPVFVADSGNDRVRIFDSAGATLGGWGAPGTATGEFDLPRGVAVDCRGVVYVADAFNDRVQVFADPERVQEDRCTIRIEDLIARAGELDLPGHAQRSLVAKLSRAADALAADRARCACNRLEAARRQLLGLGIRHGGPEGADLAELIASFAVQIECPDRLPSGPAHERERQGRAGSAGSRHHGRDQ